MNTKRKLDFPKSHSKKMVKLIPIFQEINHNFHVTKSNKQTLLSRKIKILEKCQIEIPPINHKRTPPVSKQRHGNMAHNRNHCYHKSLVKSQKIPLNNSTSKISWNKRRGNQINIELMNLNWGNRSHSIYSSITFHDWQS